MNAAVITPNTIRLEIRSSRSITGQNLPAACRPDPATIESAWTISGESFAVTAWKLAFGQRPAPAVKRFPAGMSLAIFTLTKGVQHHET